MTSSVRTEAARSSAPAGRMKTTHTTSPVLQRKCACGASHASGECETCRARRQAKTSGTTPATALPGTINQVVSGSGRPLDAATRQPMEAAFGHDFARVRVHADERAGRSAADIDARAYTVGNHIVFGAGEHRPESPDGRRLLAHELAHVVQQSRGDTAVASEAHLEREADRAADDAIRGERAHVSGRASDGVHRQGRGRGSARTPPQPRAPNRREQGIIDTARRAAAIRAQIALHRTAGIVPPSPAGRVDASTEAQMTARRLARLMFEWDNPNMEQVGDIVRSMVTFLTSNTSVVIAPANDPDCGSRAAYVRGLRPPIVLCPQFFRDSPEQQVRTMIHESAHLARIGSADVAEGYCTYFTCDIACPGGFDSADSWAQYVHCLSGQAADVPPPIVGRPGGGGGPQRGGSRSGGGGER